MRLLPGPTSGWVLGVGWWRTVHFHLLLGASANDPQVPGWGHSQVPDLTLPPAVAQSVLPKPGLAPEAMENLQTCSPPSSASYPLIEEWFFCVLQQKRSCSPCPAVRPGFCKLEQEAVCASARRGQRTGGGWWSWVAGSCPVRRQLLFWCGQWAGPVPEMTKPNTSTWNPPAVKQEAGSG